MQDWQNRVVEEEKELKSKVEKLAFFIGYDSKFDELDLADQILMSFQLDAMEQYRKVLGCRIARF